MAFDGVNVYDQTWSATSRTYTNADDLLELITNIDPTETPGVSMFGKTQARDLNHQWPIDTLAATSTAGAVDGDDYSFSTYGSFADRSWINNLCQIFRKDISVSDSSRALNPIGVRDEYEYQVMKAMQEKRRDLESTIFKIASASVTGGTAAARVMKGFRGFGGQATSPAILTAQNGAITTAVLLGLQEQMVTLGARPDTLFVSPGVKFDLTNLLNGSATINTRNIAAMDRKWINNIDVFESDFGMIAVVMDKFVPQSSASSASASYFLVERSKCRLAFLRQFKHVPLGKNGDATRGYVVGEVTLEVLHPSCVGIATGVST